VPAWLDGPVLRRLLPWAGRWQPGSGARVLPLRLRDGREVPVQPLICRDSVDPSLAIAAARLGAQRAADPVQRRLVRRRPAGCRAAPGGGGLSQRRDPAAAVPRHHQRLQRRDRRRGAVLAPAVA
jgi:hypothetical protein